MLLLADHLYVVAVVDLTYGGLWQPKDFTDDPHETLSDDLSDGIEFSNMIQIVSFE